MFYSIRHITRFAYSSPVSESVTEVRMQPRSEANQRCLKFELLTQPRTRIHGYRDYLGNIVHHFDIPGRHSHLKITAEAKVEITPPPELPQTLPFATAEEAWLAVDALADSEELWDYVAPSEFANRTSLLVDLRNHLKIERTGDPLALALSINTSIYESFDYAPQTTSVDSPIDHALDTRQGVCQDFAHIMIALIRDLGIPCRYVSGYLHHGSDAHDRSAADATHAWVEVFLPELGWVGLDPTNNLVVGERHIRAAVGRDYADVPPTRGVHKGVAQSELTVGVQVSPTEAPPPEAEMMQLTTWIGPPPQEDDQAQQQQQQ